VKKNFHLILFFFVFAVATSAQTPVDSGVIPIANSSIQQDAFIVKDTLEAVAVTDSFSKRPDSDSNRTISPDILITSPQFRWELLKHHPYFDFKTKPLSLPVSDLRKVTGKELLFYLLVFLLIVFALLKRAFPKYFDDLFRLFFRTTLKQRQIREQLMQTPLPSLLLNGFFVISGGLYITFLLRHFNLIPAENFWLLFLYCCIGLSIAYFIKFIGLKVTGWLFSLSEAADSYIFIVFIVNKMMGILLLPFLFLLAFSVGKVYTIGLTLSWCLLGGMIAYRFILTYAAIHNQVKVNPFHFFLYLCAFEIAPLLLIYKGLLLFFRITA
jgi:hypothetical protein